MMGTLEKLLQRIRDGVASPEEVAKARELVVGDARLPEELREVGLTDADDLPGDAVGLLAVLGAAPLFDAGLREALSDEVAEALADQEPVDEVDDGWLAIAGVLREGLVAEADGIEVVGGVMARLPAPEWAYGPVTAEAVLGEAGTVDVAGDAMADLGDALPPVAEAVHAEAGAVDVVGAVFAVLDLEVGPPVREAVVTEAGAVDVAGSVLAELGSEVVPVREAVAAEADEVDVVHAVLAALSLEAGPPVREAVAGEAGEVDVVASVVDTLGLDAAPVREAVAAEAGTVEMQAAVQAALQAPTALPTPPPSVLHDAPPVPAAANRTWTWGALAMAAVALVVVVGLSRLSGLGGATPQPLDFEFAAAGELVVEDLEFADDVTVMQAEGDEGAVILWMEDV